MQMTARNFQGIMRVVKIANKTLEVYSNKVKNKLYVNLYVKNLVYL